MDYMRELGALALASRMKRLVGRLNGDVKGIYAAEEIAFEPLLMPITRLLEAKGALPVNKIASSLGVTHPAVTQMCTTLKKHKLIATQPHPEDLRVREVALNNRGHDVARSLEPIWREIETAVSQMIGGTHGSLLEALEAFEERYQQATLKDRVLQQLACRRATRARIIPYDPSLKRAFKELNYEWIQKDFTVEASDRRVLSNPKKYILDKGGSIYFARLGDDVVGTYALIRVDAQTYELAKMAVTAAHQKQGIGTALLDHAIARCQTLGADRVVLYSNTRLAAALNLYFKKGFRVIAKDDYHNERANIKMTLRL